MLRRNGNRQFTATKESTLVKATSGAGNINGSGLRRVLGREYRASRDQTAAEERFQESSRVALSQSLRLL
ncbi:hypothetical protein EYF80_016792 [Liparis tanakae]|uniref:Uncharacterized protein n=1 Tax=Liparis tanakae TaxID=230148 RepID=A0A4Z2I6T8_9TELE|nr:hypothetical protein EYF80_016792 [Liparis tanakae]